MIGYYVHHHGSGHLNRAISICARLRQPVVALTSLDVPRPHPFAGLLRLPRDDGGTQPAQPTANGALHWVPHHDDGVMTRMALIARWVEEMRPCAVVVDVSVEVALFVRLLGVPVVVMTMPGDRTDGPHTLVHQLADHIVAAWPKELYEPAWLRVHAAKTSYVGGISRFDAAPRCVAEGPCLSACSRRDGRMRVRPGDGRCNSGAATRDHVADIGSAGRSTVG